MENNLTKSNALTSTSGISISYKNEKEFMEFHKKNMEKFRQRIKLLNSFNYNVNVQPL